LKGRLPIICEPRRGSYRNDRASCSIGCSPWPKRAIALAVLGKLAVR